MCEKIKLMMEVLTLEKQIYKYGFVYFAKNRNLRKNIS